MIPGATWDRGIDLVAVKRAKSDPGPCPDLTEEEQVYACRAMTDEGKSASYIASRLRVAERTVTRWRKSYEEAAEDGHGPDSVRTPSRTSERDRPAPEATCTDTHPDMSVETAETVRTPSPRSC